MIENGKSKILKSKSNNQTMGDPDHARGLARQVLELSIDGQVLILGAILGADSALAELTSPSAKAAHRAAIMRYRNRFHPESSGNSAARAIHRELALFEQTAWLALRRLDELPPDTCERRLLQFDILKSGQPWGFETIRKMLHAAGTKKSFAIPGKSTNRFASK